MSITTSGAMGSPPVLPPAGYQPGQQKSLLSYARIIDPIAMFVWAVSTILPVTFLAPLRYAVAAYFASCLFLFARQTMPAVTRSWPLFLLPVLCTISAIWAPSSDEALRKGFSLALTGLVAIYAATRVSGRNILIAYFLCELIAAVWSLRVNTVFEGAWTGMFGQKNFFAINMFTLYITALGIALDRENKMRMRLLAGVTIPLALFLVLMAKSGTTTVLALGATAMMFGHTLVWQPAAKIPHARTFIVLALISVILIAAYIVIGILQMDLKEELLGALGKDSSLTGRTMLWDIAKRQMEENPWTGLGANGYWRAERGTANTITSLLQGTEKFGGFSFHNSYFENGVNYGYPGFWASIFLAAWCCLSAGMNWLRNQTVVNFVFLVLALMFVIRTTSEADLSGEFASGAVLLFIAASRKENFGKRKLPAMPSVTLGLPRRTSR